MCVCVCFSSNNIIIYSRDLIGGGKEVKGVLGNYYFFFLCHIRPTAVTNTDVGYRAIQNVMLHLMNIKNSNPTIIEFLSVLYYESIRHRIKILSYYNWYRYHAWVP